MSLESEEAYGLRQDTNQTTLYERHGPAIFGYLRLHTRSLEDTEDLLLDVFLAALEHNNLTTMAPDKQLAWLRRVAHNKLANVHRHVIRHPQVALDPLIETLLAEKGPEQLLLQKEDGKQLRVTISKLPVLQQQILQLRYSDGLNCPEIALLLNKREGAVRKILSRSIIFLRQMYQQTEGEQLC